jgi:hypothetical protein
MRILVSLENQRFDAGAHNKYSCMNLLMYGSEQTDLLLIELDEILDRFCAAYIVAKGY